MENIFVDPEDPSKITATLDWSSTEIAPLIVRTQPLEMIEYEGPQLQGLERPTLPADLAAQSDAEQRQARKLYLEQSLVALYRTLIHKRSPEIWKCFEYQETSECELLTIARRLLHEGEAPYLARIIELVESGSEIVALSDPTDEASRARRAALMADKDSVWQYWEAAQAGMEVMGRIRQTMGDLFPEQGVVRHDQYDEAKRALGQIKEKVIEQYTRSEEDRVAWQRSWPFDD
jgi:hypothetical protein